MLKCLDVGVQRFKSVEQISQGVIPCLANRLEFRARSSRDLSPGFHRRDPNCSYRASERGEGQDNVGRERLLGQTELGESTERQLGESDVRRGKDGRKGESAERARIIRERFGERSQE